MSIESVIRGVPSWETTPNRDIADALNAKVVVKIDAKKYTWQDLVDLLDVTVVESLRLKLNTSGNEWANIQLGSGLDLSQPKLQAVLDSFIATFPQVEQIKAKGRYTTSPWKEAGNTTDITNAAAGLLRDKMVLRINGAAKYNAFVDAVDAWDGTTEKPKL